MTLVLDYRPPLADRPLTRLTMWLATPMSPRWRTAMVAASAGVLWGAAWLPGASVVEMAAWAVLGACAAYRALRGQLRWCVRCTHGLPRIGTPASEGFGSRQMLLLVLASTSSLYAWPLRVSVLIHRPLLDRFAWHAYAEAPMLQPPRTPRLVGMFIVRKVGASPNSVRISVLGSGRMLEYTPNGAVGPSFRVGEVPWFLHWLVPPSQGCWSVDSMRYKPYCG